ncbi:hypothetical protein N7461_008748 [Penicillium sp. DV-2018c]|nr:hypothetical protein N7461_008748 [Penicillium sp. DV-2018c]
MLRRTKSYIIGNHRSIPVSGSAKSEKQDKQADYNVEHVESIEAQEQLPPLGRVKSARAKFQKHWRRFWCCYLLGAIIFLAIFLPVFFLVILPAIAQRLVNDMALPVHSAEILNPRPDQVDFVLHTSLKVPLGIRIRTEPLSLNLFNRNTKPRKTYLRVDLPAYSLKGNTKLDVTKNDTKILDVDEFIKTLEDAVYNERFIMSAKGSTIGHLGALNTPLTLDKDIKLNGLDKLRGFSIESARLLLPKEADGTNLRGKAVLPNHSVFTFALGNVTLNLKSQDMILGQASIDNVVLKPGDNLVDLHGYLDFDFLIDHLGEILATQNSALREGKIELSASGNSTVYNGKHIRYFEEILNGLTITTQVPIVMLLANTLGGLMDTGEEGKGLDIAGILDGLNDDKKTELAVRSLRDRVNG